VALTRDERDDVTGLKAERSLEPVGVEQARATPNDVEVGVFARLDGDAPRSLELGLEDARASHVRPLEHVP
jgi:hypothetical protein